MAYLRCTQCGSKALVAASQCPKCAHPFNLLDARGERVKLKQCRGCGIMHRVDAHCHWCGEMKSSWRLSSATWRSAAAVAVMLTGAAAAWRVGPSVAQYTTTMVRDAREQVRSTNTAARLESPAPTMSTEVAAAPLSSDSASAVVASAMVGGAVDDSITWTPAVARTWVNVRSDASRGGQVVGVIKPTTRAMLGTDRAGWRLVKSTDVQGWVDPRLFEPDSLRTRGE
jgi:hypothetical protein